MKYIKKYEMWSDPTITNKNISVNYGDKKPVLSEVVIDTIKFIEENYDKMDSDINSTSENRVGFGHKSGLKYETIKIDTDKNTGIPYIHFFYRDMHGELCGYLNDITDYDYKYLTDYFLNIYKISRKKGQEKNKEEHKLALQKIEEEKIKNAANKFNL